MSLAACPLVLATIPAAPWAFGLLGHQLFGIQRLGAIQPLDDCAAALAGLVEDRGGHQREGATADRDLGTMRLAQPGQHALLVRRVLVEDVDVGTQHLASFEVRQVAAQVEAAATAGENLAGYSTEVWNDWGVTLAELQVWLQTPIESIGKTPAQVLLRQYPRAG